MTNREAGINVVREIMGDQAAAKLSGSADSTTFGAPIAAYAVDQVFADIWTRPGLDRRSRSRGYQGAWSGRRRKLRWPPRPALTLSCIRTAGDERRSPRTIRCSAVRSGASTKTSPLIMWDRPSVGSRWRSTAVSILGIARCLTGAEGAPSHLQRSRGICKAWRSRRQWRPVRAKNGIFAIGGQFNERRQRERSV
jgi:hypothetical protein